MSATATAADYDPAEVIESVRPWVHELARRAAARIGYPALAEELADAAFAKMGELLAEKYAGAGRYDPARGAATTWAASISRTPFFETWALLGTAFRISRYAVERHSRGSVVPNANRRSARASRRLFPGVIRFRNCRHADSRLEPESFNRWRHAQEDGRRDELVDSLRVAVSRLRGRDRYIVSRYFGLDGLPEQDMRAIGRDIGISHTRVGQLLRAALRRIERELAPAFGPAADRGKEGAA